MTMTRGQRLLLVAGLLALLWVGMRLSGLDTQFSLAHLRALFGLHTGVGLLVFCLAFMAGNLLQIPGGLFLAAAVLTLGPLWGGLSTYVAACLSCVGTFAVIRGLGGDALRGWQQGPARQRLFASLASLFTRLYTRLLARLDSHPVQSVALLRLLFQTVPALNYALALSGVRFRSYLLGTLIGLPLPIALYCIFFKQLALWLKLPV
ncbi:VTT domain-containing protein [Roseateles koreensis]|uniref:VTT domain-containing protein n=1 Tax=Roseateles koreensis TaxID=2987526 RepID=A0ABT5KQ30_9BURK|nr:VTT domain-containing protein [Roseateles koreensis]MDC8785025.1 VTT domain-containing protein [Roseateles koreensis]